MRARRLADSERGLGALRVDVDADALRAIAALAQGDARRALDVTKLDE